jgi:hypothetical protein
MNANNPKVGMAGQKFKVNPYEVPPTNRVRVTMTFMTLGELSAKVIQMHIKL